MALCNFPLQLTILAVVIVITCAASAAAAEASDLRCGDDKCMKKEEVPCDGGCDQPKDDGCDKECDEEEEEEDDGGCGCDKSRKNLRMPPTTPQFPDNRLEMQPLQVLRGVPMTPPFSDHHRHAMTPLLPPRGIYEAGRKHIRRYKERFLPLAALRALERGDERRVFSSIGSEMDHFVKANSQFLTV